MENEGGCRSRALKVCAKGGRDWGGGGGKEGSGARV